MKKTAKIWIPILVVVLIGGIVGGYVGYNLTYHPSKWLAEGDDAIEAMEYQTALASLPMMENTWEEALGQTAIHDLIEAHFAAPLPEGKTEKKAIVIGYDGCLAETFRLLATSKKSAINMLLGQGGHAVFSYAGGVNYPAENTQATSTAPGWCSMLTGVLADEHGITDNSIPKEVEPKTLLLSLVEEGKADKSAFYVSWDGHFSKKTATYYPEKVYARESGVNATYRRALFDPGTRFNILSDLKKQNCSDFIFSTMEYTDHAGHGSGFSLQNIKYVSAFRNADAAGADARVGQRMPSAGAEIIQTIQSRKTYDSEDWLILITTDHGGTGRSHGGPSIEERITFIVSNKDILPE